MKRILIIGGILLVLFLGYRVYQAGEQGTPQGVTTSNQSPSGNVEADVCIGSADFCQGVADAKKLEVENAQKQYEQMLESQKPTQAPTPSPEDVANQNRENEAKTTVLIVVLWTALVIAIIFALAWLAWQIYWHFRIKAPRDEQAADIRTSKDGKLIVARLPGNTDYANSTDQWIALDQNAMGAQLIHIDGSGIAHQLKLTDESAKYVAIAHALSEAARTNQGREYLQSLLDQWNKGANNTIKSLGDAASQWRSAGARRGSSPRPPSKMTRLTKDGNTEAGASSPVQGSSTETRSDGVFK
jgi:hypothetical protein